MRGTMGTITVGVVGERTSGERRVALVPEAVARLKPAGIDVIVEPGAGELARFLDDDYANAGAKVVPRDELYEKADVIAGVTWPADEDGTTFRPGQLLTGMLDPLDRLDLVRTLAARGITALSLDMVPRTLSRAQSMDALTSQSNVAGYKAAVLAAATYGGYFPMLTTAAGTTAPAAVLVLGAGVAGLQAIGTSARLGALVTGYDVRPQARGEVESLGARFLKLPTVDAGGQSDGYARELTPAEQRAQQAELDQQLARFDVVITTARVPGRKPPLLVSKRAIEGMHPGAVVIDLAASARGGNVEVSEPDRTVNLANRVTVIGAGNLASTVATAASTAYARNLAALLTYLARDGELVIDLGDEVQAGVVITHKGKVVNRAVAERVDDAQSREV